MSLNFNLAAATLGRVFPRYRTLGQWAETYREVIESRPIGDKTKADRRARYAIEAEAPGAESRPVTRHRRNLI